ncbi:hypothetical protein FPV67DRAFT_1411861 [Lyophyllum atratum]|nr:hypothetical protein FPV67DRAFT_1411861 [Lyophyllum atratum]
MQQESEIILRKAYTPVVSSGASLDFEVAAILGGDALYLHEDEDWPICPTCENPLIPILHLPLIANHPPEFLALFEAHEERSKSNLQFLICSDSSCFEQTVVQGDCAWLMRTVSPLAADTVCVGPREQNWLNVHSQLAEEELFKPIHVVTGWTEAKLEMVHEEDRPFVPDVSEDFYNEHEPAGGVKLLGYPTKGKFKCGDWGNGCPINEDGCKWRCIIQLGSQENEAFDLLDTSENCWIMQCEKHPEQRAFGLSGDW